MNNSKVEQYIKPKVEQHIKPEDMKEWKQMDVKKFMDFFTYKAPLPDICPEEFALVLNDFAENKPENFVAELGIIDGIFKGWMPYVSDHTLGTLYGSINTPSVGYAARHSDYRIASMRRQIFMARIESVLADRKGGQTQS